ncbi:MAG: cysteine--tRNA ligase [Candidatus Dojkabacteria bacterium]|jgi:cysteinyl-tRNA synthetase
MRLYSTLDKKIVDIQPLQKGQISIYNCGPTVYSRMQIGNIRAYVNWDILHRALVYLGYDVKRVMNITDVGHMTSDDDYGSDFGEDKLDIQSQKEGVQPIDIANKYIDTVVEDFRALNILTPNGELFPKDLTYKDVQNHGFTRATEYIDEMIEIIKKIEKNGYTYETEQALYFDVTKIEDYNIFTGQSLEEKEIGVREEVEVDSKKRHPADFVLWMKKTGKYANHLMNWDSPWGVGFPGWHIECSAMGVALLGENFDIHTGGVDHIPVHHTNERAQNIGAFGHPVVNYWIHNEWVVNRDESKISKSKGATLYLPNLVDMGFDPMDIRYYLLSINYRTRIQFSLDALKGAKNARLAVVRRVGELGTKKGSLIPEYIDRFKEALRDNLNMSKAVAILNELLKLDGPKEDILATVLDLDRVLGLDLDRAIVEKDSAVDSEVEKLLNLREKAKLAKNYQASDRLRDEILKLGYIVKDTLQGQKVEKV